MVQTLAIVGVGPGIGMAAARRFGREGYQIALISRNKKRLDGYVAELAGLGIKAGAFPADVTDRKTLVDALARAKEQMGAIDVLEFSPTPTADSLSTPRNIEVDNEQFQLDYSILGAIAATRAVLPDMLARQRGALLFTTAVSACIPIPRTASFGVAAAALRTYALTLNLDLARDGIYSGLVAIAGYIDKEDSTSATSSAGVTGPARITIRARDVADLMWDMVSKRDRAEETIGDVDSVLRMLAG